MVDEKFSPAHEVAADGEDHGQDQSAANEQLTTDDNAPRLSVRQQEILHHLVLGNDNKTIAYQLGIEIVTVKMHIGHLFRKLRVRNRTAAAVRGLQLYSDGKASRLGLPMTGSRVPRATATEANARRPPKAGRYDGGRRAAECVSAGGPSREIPSPASR
jgi:DNA-binding CsgD family transcriptional regulator